MYIHYNVYEMFKKDKMVATYNLEIEFILENWEKW